MKKALVAVVLCVVILAGCGGDEAANVEAKLNNVMDAMKAGDYDKVKMLLGENAPTKAQFDGMAEMFKEADIEFTDVKVDGDNATAIMKITGEMSGITIDESIPMTLKKVDGEWVPSMEQ